MQSQLHSLKLEVASHECPGRGHKRESRERSSESRLSYGQSGTPFGITMECDAGSSSTAAFSLCKLQVSKHASKAEHRDYIRHNSFQQGSEDKTCLHRINSLSFALVSLNRTKRSAGVDTDPAHVIMPNNIIGSFKGIWQRWVGSTCNRGLKLAVLLATSSLTG